MKFATVTSCIFHIGHDLDEPWPLEIEDHDGNVHAVRTTATKHLTLLLIGTKH